MSTESIEVFAPKDGFLQKSALFPRGPEIATKRDVTANELQDRTFRFAVGIVKLCRRLPADNAGYITGRQLIKSATSVGANYRAARRSRSRAEFASRLAIVLEEADESQYWLTLIVASELLGPEHVAGFIDEAVQLRAIFSRTCTTVRQSLER